MRQSHISKLSLKGAEDLLKQLMAKLTADVDMWEDRDWRAEICFTIDDDEDSIYNLQMLVNCLDDFLEDGDEFGTEGWRYRYDF